MLHSLRQDILFAIRSFAKVPGLTAAIVVSIGLGIAANTTVFSLVNELLIRDVPVRDPGSLLALAQGKSQTFSLPDYADYRATGVFEGLAAHCPLAPASLRANNSAPPERIWGQMVSGNYFEVVSPLLLHGRGILPQEDEVPGRNPVVVLSHSLWIRLGGDPALVGRTVALNGTPFTVVGVATPGFFGLDRGLAAEFWAPLAMRRALWPEMDQKAETKRTTHWIEFSGRLKPGVTREQATAALNVVSARIADEFHKGSKKRAEPMRLIAAGQLPEVGSMIQVLMGALAVVVGLVLLIACANVANLLLARAAAREKEIGIRLAMGASRGRLIGQLLTESVLLAAMGAAFGFLLAVPGLNVLARFQPPIPIPLRFDFAPDLRVFAFTTVLAVCTGILFGLAPALTGTRGSLVAAVRGAGMGTSGARRGRLSAVLVGVQVTLSLVLLIGSGLFLRSLQHAAAIDLGMRPDGVLMLAVDTKARGYDTARAKQFFQSADERLSRLPGVQSVSYVNIMPLSLAASDHRFHDASATETGATAPASTQANVFMVGPRYFETMGIPLVRGRDFVPGRDDNASLALINRTMAKRLFGDRDPIGLRVREGEGKTFEVIGVVGDSKAVMLSEQTRACIFRYLPSDFNESMSLLGTTIVLRASGNPASLAPAVRRAMEDLDPTLAVFGMTTMSSHVDKALMLPRVCAALFGIFGAIGLVLAAVGLYGVVNYSVRTRTREIGIRMALGARSGDVLVQMARQGLAVVAAGLVLGLAVAFAVSRFTASLLYGITPTDPITFAGVPLILLLVAAVAILVPARRAARMEPMSALHYE